MMDALAYLTTSWLQPELLALTALGTAAGIYIGAIPGLSVTMAVSILISFTFSWEVNHALALMNGIFMGGVYGGSRTAILLNIPGAPAAIATALDGYPLEVCGLFAGSGDRVDVFYPCRNAAQFVAHGWMPIEQVCQQRERKLKQFGGAAGMHTGWPRPMKQNHGLADAIAAAESCETLWPVVASGGQHLERAGQNDVQRVVVIEEPDLGSLRRRRAFVRALLGELRRRRRRGVERAEIGDEAAVVVALVAHVVAEERAAEIERLATRGRPRRRTRPTRFHRRGPCPLWRRRANERRRSRLSTGADCRPPAGSAAGHLSQGR